MTDNDYGANLLDVVEKVRSMQACIEVMYKKVESMYVMQRIDDDILRKSANSINVIVRLLAGCCRLENQDLWNTLIVSGALLDNVRPSTDVRPSMDLGFDHIPISHSKLQQLKFILQDLIRILESPENTEATSTPNNNSDNNNIPSTSTQNRMHSVSPVSSTISSEGQSNSDITSNTDMAENTHHVNNNDNNSITSDRTSVHNDTVSTVVKFQEIENVQATNKILNTSESEMFPDSRLTDDIERASHNDNSITSDRMSVHNNIATNIEGLQEIENAQATSKIQSTSESEMFPDSHLTDDIERDSHSDNSVISDRTSVHNNTATSIGELQEIENAQTTSKIQSTSESEMFPDSRLTDDIERDSPNDNSITSDRTSVHNNTATSIGGLQEIENAQATSKIQSTSESDMLPDSSLTDDIEHDSHNDNSITSDRTSVHNNTATIIGGLQEIENGQATSKIQSTSEFEMFPDSRLTDDIERDNSNVNSTFLGMTPIHARLCMKHPAASVRIVESEETRALRRKYKNKYRYIDNYKNKNENPLSEVSGIKKITSNVSSENRWFYEPRLILNKFKMIDPDKDLEKTKASGSNQTTSEDRVTTRNSTNLDNKRKSNDDGVDGSNSAQESAANRNKNKERSSKKKKR